MRLSAVLNDRVRLVAMQHDRGVGQTVSPAAPIAGTLHAGERAANRVGVAAVHHIRFALGPRFDPLDVIYRPGVPRWFMLTRHLKKSRADPVEPFCPGPPAILCTIGRRWQVRA